MGAPPAPQSTPSPRRKERRGGVKGKREERERGRQMGRERKEGRRRGRKRKLTLATVVIFYACLF